MTHHNYDDWQREKARASSAEAQCDRALAEAAGLREALEGMMNQSLDPLHALVSARLALSASPLSALAADVLAKGEMAAKLYTEYDRLWQEGSYSDTDAADAAWDACEEAIGELVAAVDALGRWVGGG